MKATKVYVAVAATLALGCLGLLCYGSISDGTMSLKEAANVRGGSCGTYCDKLRAWITAGNYPVYYEQTSAVILYTDSNEGSSRTQDGSTREKMASGLKACGGWARDEKLNNATGVGTYSNSTKYKCTTGC